MNHDFLDELVSGAQLDPESDGWRDKQRTLAALAWLHPIAEVSVSQFGWHPSILQWIDQFGARLADELKPH